MLSREYLAGFFDGEGCVMLSPRKSALGKTFYGRVVLTNTDLLLLELIQDQYGGSIRKQVNGNPERPCYHLTISYNNAEKFLEDISPFVFVKKQQVEALIDWVSKRRILLQGLKRLTKDKHTAYLIFSEQARKIIKETKHEYSTRKVLL